MKYVIFSLSTILLSGCVSYKTVGSFDDYNEVLYGTVHANLMTGGGEFTLIGEKTKLKCAGIASAPYYIPPSLSCTGQRGVVDGSCDDGRFIEGEWFGLSCTTGIARGKDNTGKMFAFTFGMDEKGAQVQIRKQLAKNESKPNLPEYNTKETRKQIGFATGTGFIVSEGGYLLTNYHVVEDSNKITVKLPDGAFANATKIILDKANDLALLKIQSSVKFKPLLIGASNRSLVGEEVMTYGFPLIQLQGQAPKATFGRINSLSGIQDDIRFMQIDVPIQPGNSGGPLITTQGEVIGITTATLSGLKTLKESGAIPQNVNYAVKMEYCLPILNQIGIKPTNSSSERTLKFSQIVKEISSSVILVVAE